MASDALAEPILATATAADQLGASGNQERFRDHRARGNLKRESYGSRTRNSTTAIWPGPRVCPS